MTTRSTLDWPERPARTVRTFDYRDCQHCAQYTSGGNSSGTPPWHVCQPRLQPATCGHAYAYKHRSWLNEDGEHWFWAKPAGGVKLPPQADEARSDSHEQADAETTARTKTLPRSTSNG